MSCHVMTGDRFVGAGRLCVEHRAHIIQDFCLLHDQISSRGMFAQQLFVERQGSVKNEFRILGLPEPPMDFADAVIDRDRLDPNREIRAILLRILLVKRQQFSRQVRVGLRRRLALAARAP